MWDLAPWALASSPRWGSLMPGSCSAHMRAPFLSWHLCGNHCGNEGQWVLLAMKRNLTCLDASFPFLGLSSPPPPQDNFQLPGMKGLLRPPKSPAQCKGRWAEHPRSVALGRSLTISHPLCGLRSYYSERNSDSGRGCFWMWVLQGRQTEGGVTGWCTADSGADVQW